MRASTGSPRTCSGDMYPTVPATPARLPSERTSVASSLVTVSRSSCFARPKSSSFARPSVVTNTFSGLRSR